MGASIAELWPFIESPLKKWQLEGRTFIWATSRSTLRLTDCIDYDIFRTGILLCVIIYKKFSCRPNSFYTMAVYIEACIEGQFSGICSFSACVL